MLNPAELELGADLRDLRVEVVDQQQAGVDRAAPRLGDLKLVEQPPALDDRTGRSPGTACPS